jgi:hypothetical protein
MIQELITKRNKLLFSSAISFFCKELGLTVEEQDMITVQEVNRLSPGTSGTCTGVYDGPNDSLSVVQIRILGYASIMGMIDVLAHELVHARQHVRNEFYTEKVKHRIFFDLLEIEVLEKFHKGQRLLTTPYYDRLCEIEAHLLSHELMLKFCAKIYDEKYETESTDIEIEEPLEG